MYLYRRCALGRIKNTKHSEVPFKNTGVHSEHSAPKAPPLRKKCFFLIKWVKKALPYGKKQELYFITIRITCNLIMLFQSCYRKISPF